MAQAGMFATTDLIEPLAERGVAAVDIRRSTDL